MNAGAATLSVGSPYPERMKVLLLSAALLLPVASAQVTIPATPPAAPSTPVAPAVPVAPAAPASAPTLSLSAPVGTGLELATTTTSRTTISNVQVTALPGSGVSAAELDAIRNSVPASLAGGEATTVSGNLFYRVTNRDANGSVTLLTTTVQGVPGQPPVSLKITQTLGPNGAVGGLKFESDNPALQAVLAGLSAEKLRELAGQNGSNFAGIYGQPLVQGQPRMQTAELDATGMLSGMFSAFAGQAGAQDLFGQVQSTPLRVTTTITYGGLNAQGLHTFASSGRYGPWQIKAGGGDFPGFDVELSEGQVSGTQTYRADGLPGPATQNPKMVMNMTMELEGVRLKLTMTIEQTVAAKLR